MARRMISLFLCFCFLFTQTGFAQAASVELNLASHFARMANSLTVEKFRPPHLRYFSYDTLNNTFKVLLDKGDLKQEELNAPNALNAQTKELLKYFLIGVTLDDDKFWVNLRPDAEDQIIDSMLEQTDIGKVFLEADLQLKKDTSLFTSPQTPEGKEYWNKLYKKAEELYGLDNVTIPTLTRPWIVPGEIIVRETVSSQDNETTSKRVNEPSAYIYKATLKVMLEADYLKEKPQGAVIANPGRGEAIQKTGPSPFSDPRAKALNEYSTQLIRELIIPKLTKEVNTSKRYAQLRQVYYSLILSRWFKSRFTPGSVIASPSASVIASPSASVIARSDSDEAIPTFVNLINKQDLTNLTSKDSWSRTPYFEAYKKSFTEGEYNLKEPHYTPTGQVIRSYFSGGIKVVDIYPNGFTAKNSFNMLSKTGWGEKAVFEGDGKSLVVKPVLAKDLTTVSSVAASPMTEEAAASSGISNKEADLGYGKLILAEMGMGRSQYGPESVFVLRFNAPDSPGIEIIMGSPDKMLEAWFGEIERVARDFNNSAETVLFLLTIRTVIFDQKTNFQPEEITSKISEIATRFAKKESMELEALVAELSMSSERFSREIKRKSGDYILGISEKSTGYKPELKTIWKIRLYEDDVVRGEAVVERSNLLTYDPNSGNLLSADRQRMAVLFNKLVEAGQDSDLTELLDKVKGLPIDYKQSAASPILAVVKPGIEPVEEFLRAVRDAELREAGFLRNDFLAEDARRAVEAISDLVGIQPKDILTVLAVVEDSASGLKGYNLATRFEKIAELIVKARELQQAGEINSEVLHNPKELAYQLRQLSRKQLGLKVPGEEPAASSGLGKQLIREFLGSKNGEYFRMSQQYFPTTYFKQGNTGAILRRISGDQKYASIHGKNMEFGFPAGQDMVLANEINGRDPYLELKEICEVTLGVPYDDFSAYVKLQPTSVTILDAKLGLIQYWSWQAKSLDEVIKEQTVAASPMTEENPDVTKARLAVFAVLMPRGLNNDGLYEYGSALGEYSVRDKYINLQDILKEIPTKESEEFLGRLRKANEKIAKEQPKDLKAIYQEIKTELEQEGYPYALQVAFLAAALNYNSGGYYLGMRGAREKWLNAVNAYFDPSIPDKVLSKVELASEGREKLNSLLEMFKQYAGDMAQETRNFAEAARRALESDSNIQGAFEILQKDLDKTITGGNLDPDSATIARLESRNKNRLMLLDRLNEVMKVFSSSPQTTASSALDKKGGIDFRREAMASSTVYKPMGSFEGLNFTLPFLSKAELDSIDLVKEVEHIKSLVSGGIMPEPEFTKRVIAAAKQTGKLDVYIDDLMLAFVGICEWQEDNDPLAELPDGIKEAMVIIDSVDLG